MSFDVMAEGVGFPEGPVVMPDGSLVVVEVGLGRLLRLWGDGRREVLAETGGGPNGAAIGPDGALYVCNNGGLAFIDFQGLRIPEGTAADYDGGWIDRVDPDSGAVERLYEACDGVRLKGPNDIVFDPDGGFWFTDYGHVHDRIADLGAIYYAKPDGSAIGEARFPMRDPNGIGLSPDGKRVIVAETFTSRVWALEKTGSGEIAPALPTSPGTLLHGEPRYRLFDSLAVMADGKVAVGTLVEGGITTIGNDEPAEFYALPDPMVTNVAFGGDDLRTAYMTGSATGTVFRARWGAAGLKLAF